MKTTLTQIELAGEVLDLTDFATQEGVNALGGKIDTLTTAFDDIYAQQLDSIIG